MCNFIKADGKQCSKPIRADGTCQYKSHNKKIELLSKQEYNNSEPTQDNNSDMPPQPESTTTIIEQATDVKEIEMPTMTEECVVELKPNTAIEKVYTTEDNLDKNNEINSTEEINTPPATPLRVNIQYVMENKRYDPFLYELCTIISDNWFKQRDNLWKLAGLCYTTPGESLSSMRRTYCAILYTKLKRFDSKEAKDQFNSWENSKYHCKLTVRELKSIAAGCNAESYKEWKDKYEPEPVQEIKSKRSKKQSEDIEFSKTDLLRITKISQLTGIAYDKIIEGIDNVSSMLEEDWLEKYVNVVNRPILGYKRQWQLYIRYIQSIRFTSRHAAAALLAMTIDHYVILMGDSFLSRCGLDNDYTNDVLKQEKKNPLEEINITHHAGDGRYIHTCAKKIYDINKSLFHTYEEHINQWGTIDNTKFSSCVPFRGQIVNEINMEVLKPFLEFVKDIICDGDNEQYQWLIKWIAHTYQYPNSRTRCALILLSKEEGTGKGTFCDIICYIFGIHNIDQSGGSVKSLVSDRISHLMGKKFAMVQEMRENKGDYMGCMEALKSFITDDYIAVRPLYANKMTVRNAVELIMTTNNENILKASTTGRRFTVMKLSNAKMQDNKYFSSLKKHCSSNIFIDNIATYLNNIDVAEGSIKALITEALESMAIESANSVETYWAEMKDTPDLSSKLHFHKRNDAIHITKANAYESYKEWCEINRENIFSSRKFGSETKHIKNIDEYRTPTIRYWQLTL